MLTQILGGAEGDVTEDTLAALVGRRDGENQRLEFKVSLPGNSDAERKELAKDVAAMANAGGGLIVFGIAEDAHGQAKELVPLELGRDRERLQQIITSRIEPFLQVAWHEIESGQADRGYLLLEVHSSARRPHAARERERLGYYMRVDRTTHALAESQVAEMYRTRWDAQQKRTSQKDALVAELERVSSVPVLWAVAVPLDVDIPLFRIDNELMAKIQDPARYTYRLNSLEHVIDSFKIPSDLRVAFRRIEMSHGWSQDRIERRGWVQLADGGQYLDVMPGKANDDREAFRFDLGWTMLRYVGSLVRYRTLATIVNLVGEVHLVSGLRTPDGSKTVLTRGPWDDPAPRASEGDQVSVDRTVVLDELFDGPALMRITKYVLEPLFTLFGQVQLDAIRADGSVRKSGIPRDGLRAFEHWATENGVRVVD